MRAGQELDALLPRNREPPGLDGAANPSRAGRALLKWGNMQVLEWTGADFATDTVVLLAPPVRSDEEQWLPDDQSSVSRRFLLIPLNTVWLPLSYSGNSGVNGVSHREGSNGKLGQACAAPGCGSRFSLVSRRHHCRACGRIFCKACTLTLRRPGERHVAHDPAVNC